MEYIFIALLMGTLASFSPCVIPLLPILIGQINCQAQPNNAYYFIIGVIIANTLVGITIALLKNSFVEIFQSTFMQVTFALILIYSLLIMMGLVPKTFKHINFSPKPKPFSIMLYGTLSALVLSPCTTAPMVAAINLSLQHTAVPTMIAFGIGSVTSLVLANAGMSYLKPNKWLQAIMAITILTLAINIIINAFSLSYWYTIILSLILGAGILYKIA